MRIEEYKARKILKNAGIKVPDSFVVGEATEIDDNISRFKEKKLVVKAQVKLGGRGKAGGIKVCQNLKEALKTAKNMLGRELVTSQGREKIKNVLIAEWVSIEQEIFLSFILHKNIGKPVVQISPLGGIDIESQTWVLEKVINPLIGLTDLKDYEITEMGFFCGLEKFILQFSDLVKKLYQIFKENQMLLLEINPLALSSGELVCVDVKMDFDDSFLPALSLNKEMSSILELDSKRVRHKYYLFEGNGEIGMIAHGAGMALATIDLCNLNELKMAGFLDIDVGADVDAEAFAKTIESIVAKDDRIKLIFGNIYTGVIDIQIITGGLLLAAGNLSEMPMVFRLEGLERKTKAEKEQLLAPLKAMKNLYVYSDYGEAFNKLKSLVNSAEEKRRGK